MNLTLDRSAPESSDRCTNRSFPFVSLRGLLGFLLLTASALSMHAVDWSKKLPFARKSQYFEFHYQRETWDAAAFARFADGFVDLVNRDFVKLGFDYPIQVLVLPDRATFQQFLKKEFVVRDPPNFGMYFPAFKVFVTFEDSGLGTFAHEIMHPLLDRNLRNCPVWATEAVPAFFEKFIGYWDADKLVLQWGYQNPWRIEALGDKLAGLDLARIVNDRRPVTNFDNSERRLVTVFLWRAGRFERFLRLLADNTHAGYDSCFEAAMEQPLKALVPQWQNYLQEIASHRAEIMKVPASVVLPNRPAFEQALAIATPWRQTQTTP